MFDLSCGANDFISRLTDSSDLPIVKLVEELGGNEWTKDPELGRDYLRVNAELCEAARLAVGKTLTVYLIEYSQWDESLGRRLENGLRIASNHTKYHYHINVNDRLTDFSTFLTRFKAVPRDKWDDTQRVLAVHGFIRFVRREFYRESTAPQDMQFGIAELSYLCERCGDIAEAVAIELADSTLQVVMKEVGQQTRNTAAEILGFTDKARAKSQGQSRIRCSLSTLSSSGIDLTGRVIPKTVSWEDELTKAMETTADFDTEEKGIDFTEVPWYLSPGLGSTSPSMTPGEHTGAARGQSMKLQDEHRKDIGHGSVIQQTASINAAIAEQYPGKWVAYKINERVSGSSIALNYEVLEAGDSFQTLDKRYEGKPGIMVDYFDTREASLSLGRERITGPLF